jgi:prepilin-type N-terminal cleavage/methylation domain-containing protein
MRPARVGQRWDRGRTRWGRPGFTLIELLIGVAIIGILAAVAIPTYLGFVQKARETALMHYLRAMQKGQELWRAEVDSLGYCGDFDELEETGYVPDAQNFVAVRRRAARTGRVRTTSSRVVKEFRVDLGAVDNPGTNTYTVNARAHPVNRNPKVRWFYMDQTGIIRAGIGAASAGSPPVN